LTKIGGNKSVFIIAYIFIDINRNIDIEKDKAIPSLEEMFLANDWDLPF